MRRSASLDTTAPTVGGCWQESCWVSRTALLAAIIFMAPALAVLLAGAFHARPSRDLDFGIVALGCLSLALDAADLVWGTAKLRERVRSMTVTAALCCALVLTAPT